MGGGRVSDAGGEGELFSPVGEGGLGGGLELGEFTTLNYATTSIHATAFPFDR